MLSCEGTNMLQQEAMVYALLARTPLPMQGTLLPLKARDC